jgi:hypothetical protein
MEGNEAPGDQEDTCPAGQSKAVSRASPTAIRVMNSRSP